MSRSQGFEIKPLEARYLRIPLEVLTEGGQIRMAQAPLVIYIAKYSTILDDESRIKMTKKMPESDLQVFVSRNKEWPTYAKHDIRYDFTKPDNVLHICQIKIYPLNSRERFHQDEEWISVGLYSLQGLPDIAMIYGFG